MRISTPWLTPGEHKLGIFWENVNSRVQLRIRKLVLQQLDGPDANGNGIKDWVEVSLSSGHNIAATPAQSVVSPYCLEGAGRYVDMMSIAVNGQSNAVPVKPGAGHRWYADVPLSPTGTTAIAVSFQQGALTRGTQIAWVPLNLLQGSNLTIRAADALMLTAHPDGATNGTVNLTVAGVTNLTTTVDQPAIVTFPTPGEYTRGNGVSPCVVAELV